MPGMEYVGYAVLIGLIFFLIVVPLAKYLFLVIYKLGKLVFEVLWCLLACIFYAALPSVLIACVMSIWIDNYMAVRIGVWSTVILSLINILGTWITPCRGCRYYVSESESTGMHYSGCHSPDKIMNVCFGFCFIRKR